MERKMKNKEIKKYLNEVKLMLPINSKDKREFLNQLNDYIANSDIDTYQEAVKHFGKPNEVATSFLGDMDTELLIKKLRKKRYIQFTCLIILICIFLVSGFRIWRLNQLYNEFKEDQPVIVETEIIEEVK